MPVLILDIRTPRSQEPDRIVDWLKLHGGVRQRTLGFLKISVLPGIPAAEFGGSGFYLAPLRIRQYLAPTPDDVANDTKAILARFIWGRRASTVPQEPVLPSIVMSIG